MPVAATFTVTFSEQAGVGVSIKMEYDTTRTQFFPGQDVPIRAYVVGTLVALKSNLGTLNPNGTGVNAVEDERIAFNGDSASLDYPASSGFSSAWEGIVLDEDGNEISGPTPSLQADGQTLAVDENVYGILIVSYNANYLKRILTGVPTDKLEAVVFGLVK